MAKVRFDSTQWETVCGDGLTVELLLRRVTDLERIELAAMAAAESRTVEETEGIDDRHRPYKRSVTTFTPDPTATPRAMREAIRRTVRDWRAVEDGDGKPVAFSHEKLEQVTANYRAWADQLWAIVACYAGLEKLPAETPPNPTSGRSPAVSCNSVA